MRDGPKPCLLRQFHQLHPYPQIHTARSYADLQGDVLGELYHGLQQIQLQKIHHAEQFMDLQDKHCNTDYSITSGTVQNRQCRKVDEQICSRTHHEQCKDVSTRKCSTSYGKGGVRQTSNFLRDAGTLSQGDSILAGDFVDILCIFLLFWGFQFILSISS